jgi:hypothetical protein
MKITHKKKARKSIFISCKEDFTNKFFYGKLRTHLHDKRIILTIGTYNPKYF